MLKRGLLLGVAALACTGSAAEQKDWFKDAGYGLFIHWGAYSVPAKGEWYLNKSQMDPREYETFADAFKADRFDARDWAAKVRRWGMRYVVFTTRHHDGFAMWDSDVNPYNCMNRGPKRDVLGELVPALRAEGLKVGFYYSPANWSNPDYAGYRVRGWPRGQNPWKSEDARKRFISYYRAELNELLDRYGAPDYLWWDGCLPEDGLDNDQVVGDLRERFPNMLQTERMGAPFDVRCCECEIRPPKESGALWESCMTLNDHWGYAEGDENWKSADQVIDMLLQCRGNGGNLLINVGPKSDGTIPAGSVRVLDEVGRFLAQEGVLDAFSVYADSVAYPGDSRSLQRVFDKAERGETIRIAVMGGSITEGSAAGGVAWQWGSLFAAGWRRLFPQAKVEFLNAGVGATGSMIGSYRYSRDVSPFKPDVVVFEFSVNDSDCDDSTEFMEGLLRHAVREGTTPLLLGMTRKEGTNAQAAHIRAARKYGVPFVSYRDGVMKQISEGRLKWGDVGADGVHPNRRGHALAGELMNLFVRDEWRKYRADRNSKPGVNEPAITHAFERGTFTLFSDVKLQVNKGFSPYEESRWGRGLEAKDAGARLAFDFEGGSGVLVYRKGALPLGKVCIVVDGVELKERPDGAGSNAWWLTPTVWLCRDKPGRHHVEIETLPAEPAGYAGFRVCALMVGP